MTAINPVFRRTSKAGLVYLLALFIFMFVGSIYNLLPHFTKSHLVNEKNLIKLGTFYLQGKAYAYKGSPKSGPSFVEFESKSGQKFHLSAEQLQAVIDLKELTDTLMYDNLNFIAYSNKEGHETYLSGSNKVIIIYQLEIGNKKYIDINNLNTVAKSTLIKKSVFWGALYIMLFIFIFRNRKIIKESFTRSTAKPRQDFR